MNVERQKKYREYLQGDQWRLNRTIAFERGHKCYLCGRDNKSIQVHHKNYNSLFKEQLKDVVALCGRCHKKLHFGKRGGKRTLEQALHAYLKAYSKKKRKEVLKSQIEKNKKKKAEKAEALANGWKPPAITDRYHKSFWRDRCSI